MEKLFFKNSKGQKICGVLHERNRKSSSVVLFVHGFSSTKGTSAKILSLLLEEKGINALRIDLDNRGESEPKFEEGSILQYVETTLSATKFLEERGYKKIHLSGTSYGGVVGLLAAQQYAYVSLILRCPGAGMWKRLEEYEGKDSWKYTSNKTGKTYDMGIQFYNEIKDISMTNLAKKLSCPTLIIHGTEDKTCYFSWSEEMAVSNPKMTLAPIQGADHDLSQNGDYSLSQKTFVEWFEQFK